MAKLWSGRTGGITAQSGFINATDLADYLVGKGLPFRSAYKISGEIVAQCIAQGTVLEELPLAAYRAHSELFGQDVYEAISLERCVAKRQSLGGTAPESVKAQIAWAKAELAAYGFGGTDR